MPRVSWVKIVSESAKKIAVDWISKNEKLLVDTGCLVAFTSGVDYDIQQAGNLKSIFFGGEGIFLASLQGRGTVWLQTLPFARLADRILAVAHRSGKTARGEGSILGGLARSFED